MYYGCIKVIIISNENKYMYKSQNEEEAFELRSQLEEIYQYWSVCL